MSDLKAFANIELNATPTADNHLVTKSYLTNNFIAGSSVASAWSGSGNYSVGDLVFYNGKLYRCTTAGTSNNPSGSGWVEAKVTDTATTTSYGLVKPGTGISVSSGTLLLNSATASSLGGVKVGDGLTVSSGTVSVSWGRKKALSQMTGLLTLANNIGVYVISAMMNTTISFNTVNLITLTGYSIEFTLILVEPVSLITYTLPGTVTWLNDAPVMDTINTAYIIDVFSYNTGGTWFASYKGSVPSSAISIS